MTDQQRIDRYAARPLYPRFLLALFTGHVVAVKSSPDVCGFEGWTDDQLHAVIDIAKDQLDRQTSNLDRVLTRSQALFTALLALVGLWISVAPSALFRPGAGSWLVSFLLLATLVLYLVALMGSVAVIAVRKQYEAISATVVAGWEAFDLLRLAREYTKCVPMGDQVSNNHLTVFGTAVKLTLAGSLCFAVPWLLQR